MLALFVLDSANLSLIERWIHEDKLPNLAALWRNSRRSLVGGPFYFDEIGTMLTAFSGIPVTQHGYYSARYLQPGTYNLTIQSLNDAPATPFWANLPQQQFRSLILEPIEAIPVPHLNGDQLFNLTAHQENYARHPLSTFPASLATEVSTLFGPPPNFIFDQFQLPLAWYQQQFQAYLDVLARKTRLFAHLLRRNDYNLAVFGFNETHDCAHILWQFFEHRQPHRDPQGLLANALETLYIALDRSIGELLALLPPNATVAVLSTYAIKDQFPTLELAEHLMTAAGYTVPQTPTTPSALSLARTLIPEPIRFAISKRLPSATQQSLLASRFASTINWHKTSAVVLPVSLFSSHIRVNLQGREPHGVIAPGAELNHLLDDIEATFRALIDPITGEPAVAAVLRPPQPNLLLPDLYIHYRPARHFLATTHHPRLGTLTQRPAQFQRSSYHTRPGFLSLSHANPLPPEIALEQIAPLLHSTLCAS